MKQVRCAGALCVGLVFLGSVLVLEPRGQGFAQVPLYWCPGHSADQQLGAASEPGCTPLVGEEPAGDKTKPRPSIPVEQLEIETPRFLAQYHEFLACCAHEMQALATAQKLEAHANDLLRASQQGLFSEQIKLRGFTLRKLIPPVAQARDHLRSLQRRLAWIQDMTEQLDSLEPERAAHMRRRIADEHEAIEVEARGRAVTGGPSTGLGIGVTPPMGPRIGIVPLTGPEIGTVPPTSSETGTTPPTGRDIGVTPPTGFDIGTTGRVGPGIGDSTLNEPPR